LGSGRSVNAVALSRTVKRGTLGLWVKAARDAKDRDADPDGPARQTVLIPPRPSSDSTR
jgi:hypothetical protein